MRPDLVRAIFAAAGILLFVVPGLGLVSGVRVLRRLPFATRAAWAYLLGIAWVAGGAYVASHLFAVPLKRTLFLWLAAVPAVVAAAAALSGRAPAPARVPKRPRPRDPAVVAAIAAAFFVCAGLYGDALRNPLMDYDGRMIWFAQARFVREERTVDAAAVRDDRWYLTNRRYPLLMPLAQIAAQETLNLPDDERTIRPLYATFFPVFLLLLWSGGTRLAGRHAAALGVLAASVVPYLAFWNHGGAAGGYSDFPLACFLGAGALLLLLARTWPAGLAAGALLGAGVLTKREGLPAACACVAVAALWSSASRWRQGGRAPWPALVPAALLVAAAGAFFAHWVSGIVRDEWDEQYFKAFRNPETWRARAPRLASAFPNVVRETFDTAQWGILWAVVPAAALLSRRAFRRPRVLALAAFAGIAPALGLAAYSVHWDPPALASVTWGRFLIQSSLPAFLVFTACLGECLRRKPAGPGGNRS